MVCYNNAAIAAATKEAESPMFGIKTLCDGTVGWMVGKNNDVVLFPDKGAAAAALRKMKASDAYSWNCQVEVAAFPGWGKK